MESSVSQKEHFSQIHMEELVKNCKVFMDTCSIVDAEISFWEHIKPFLKKYDKKVIIPY